MTKSVTKRLFGTDGIRGRVNQFPITVEFMLKLGKIIGFKYGDCIVGYDTRMSSDMLEYAFVAGVAATGVSVTRLGCVPTPAVALCSKIKGMVGIVISASHNLFVDNGVKFFDKEGKKFSMAMENELEKLLHVGSTYAVQPEKITCINNVDDATDFYTDFLHNQVKQYKFPAKLKVIIDSANGATSDYVQEVFSGLGLSIIFAKCEYNGININWNCGVLHPDNLRKLVLMHDADLGIAFDGDGDRVILCDEKGKIVNGDQILAFLAKHMLATKELKNNVVVATVMSNFGLESYLWSMGLRLVRTQVGDKFVVHKMQEEDGMLGGEQSGHIVLYPELIVDAMAVSLKLLNYICEDGDCASNILHNFTPVPQICRNIKCMGRDLLDKPSVQEIIDKAKMQIGEEGRLLVRKSGTEDVLRIMVEGPDLDKIQDILYAVESILVEV